jgi:ribosome assembly protein SQT1
VQCGRFTPDGKAVVTGGGGADATLRAWDPKSGTCSATIEGAHFHTVGVCPALGSSGQLQGSSGALAEGQQALIDLPCLCHAGLTALDVYTDSATVLTGAEDGSTFLSNIQSGRILGQLHGMTPSLCATLLVHSPYAELPGVAYTSG